MAVKDVTKAVIPAAGLGTRFLPATKATPKEMLPVVDKPAIQYVVEEAVAAGLDDVLMITGRSKVSIENHFDRAYELEEALAAKGDAERLAQVRESSDLATVHYVRQGDPKGLGHAVLCAAHHVGDEPFAVLLGDDLIDSRDPLLSRMIEVRKRHGGSVVALMEVDPEQVSQYGCAAITPTAEEDVVTVTDLVEKPVPGSAPSNWILIGRYVCDPAVFEVLRETPPGRGGEIQLTDALLTLAKRGPGRRRRRDRRAVPRPPLRHRQQAGLPAHRGPVRLRALRPGRGDRALAAQVPGQPSVSHSGELTPVEEHLAEILATITPLTPTELGLNDIGGLVLAEDVSAVSALPSFDNSGMDGYAVRVEDVAAATEEKPVTLPVTAEVAAGDTGAYALQPGTAIKIMTGAMLPHGAEAVVPVEWTDGGSARVSIRASAEYGNAIRLAGEDAKAGEVLVTAGTRLRPMHVAVIAAAGRGSVLVRPRPRVVVLSTGNELAEPGTPLVPGRIWDSNSFMLAAAAREAGCLAYRQAILPDHPDEVLPAIEDQLVRADLMVTTGGVSMGGEHDVVKAALQQLGTITFRKVAMQPGMPQGFGTIALPAAVAPAEPQRRRFRRDGYEEAATPVPAAGDRVPIFTLPGNPVSAYVSFQVFARPAIAALQGYHELGLEKVRAELTGPLRSPAGWRSFLRGVLDRAAGKVTPLTGQGSHQIATLGKANALVVVPEWVVQMSEGDTAEVLVLP